MEKIPQRLPASSKQVQLLVNGKTYKVSVPARTTLAEALREELQLTGTKIGCNRAECGTCTVIMDSKPVLSCTILAFEAQNSKIETVEGLSDGERLHPLQEAFIEHDALQCGICIPGMLMSAKALLDADVRPSEADVKNAIAGNLCRCGAYPNIISAVLAAARTITAKGCN